MDTHLESPLILLSSHQPTTPSSDLHVIPGCVIISLFLKWRRYFFSFPSAKTFSSFFFYLTSGRRGTFFFISFDDKMKEKKRGRRAAVKRASK
jgi:hypothetical protein